MKKSIAILLTIILFVISGIQSVMACFMVPENMNGMEISSNMHQSMSDMQGDCIEMMNDCQKNLHECCLSPFKETGMNAIFSMANNEEKTKIKVLDLNYLSILNDDLEHNYINQLNSPPKESRGIVLSNSYPELVGIIKNNC